MPYLSRTVLTKDIRTVFEKAGVSGEEYGRMMDIILVNVQGGPLLSCQACYDACGV